MYFSGMEVVRKGQLVLHLARCTIQQSCRCVVNTTPFTRGSHGNPTLPQNPDRKSEVGNAGKDKAQKINMAMKAYLERAQAHDSFMKDEIADYEIGKRHLANIMSLDADSLTQEDIDKAIQYLLPSGLFDKKARPKMKHPSEAIPQRKAAQFGLDGRPFDSQFYTGSPNFYAMMHDLVDIIENLKKFEDRMLSMGKIPDSKKKLNLAGSEWIDKLALESMTQETLSDINYEGAIKLLERLASQAYAHREKDTILKYRKELQALETMQKIPELLYDADGVGYQTATARRKRATATVTVRNKGVGRVNINGEDLLGYFPSILDREQILFPLQFTNKLLEVDFEATTEEGGHSGQAGAIRHALALALRSFVDRDMVENMRLAGLLTSDLRTKERKKPGQMRARRKYTWKKR